MNNGTPLGSPGRSSSVLRTTLIAFAAFSAWEVVQKPISGLIRDSLGEVYQMLFIRTVALLLVLAIARGMGHWEALGFRGPLRPASLAYGVPLFLLAAAPLSSGTPVAGLGMLLLWAAMIAIGVTVEEVLCRGLLWDALEAKGLWRTAVVTSMAFGSMHLLGLGGSIPATVVLSQAVFAFGTGFTFAAVRVASGNVWAPTLAHFVFNYPALVAAGGIASTFQPGTEVRMLSAGVVLGLVGVGLMAVAKRRHEKPLASGLTPGVSGS